MTPKQIKVLRTDRGLTQEQFARELGVSHMTISRWEKGRSIPRGLSRSALDKFSKRKAA
jgi:DNA-binding transcriptional regulator YiaG